MINDFELPYAEFNGEGFELGWKIGSFFRKRIAEAYTNSQFMKKLRKIDQNNPKITDSLVMHGDKYFPRYMDEIRGMAEGAQWNVRDLYLMNFRHSYQYGCSTILWSDPSSNVYILAHNEDHEYFMAKNSYIAKIQCENGLKFISHFYPGCLAGPSFWLNSNGIGLTGNAINDRNKPMGIPKGLLDRKAVESRTLEEAIHTLCTQNRSGGYSYNLFSGPEKKLINLETTSSANSLKPVKSIYFHTNHYIHELFKNIPNKAGNSSDRRYKAIKRKIEQIKKSEKQDNPEIAQIMREILLDKEVHVDPGFMADRKNEKGAENNKTASCTACTALFSLENQKIQLEIISHNGRSKKRYNL